MSAGRVLFDGVWKRFHRGPAYDSLRDLIPAIMGKTGRHGTELGADDFWAVKDLSFDVQPGNSLGIIGGNGAGKSTTLKLLTKILQPTRGHAELRGRVGALIEVSAGFHQDLTGRENVFLQGAIMGMPQALIRKQFDAIVEFSGVGPFIDTPVKRYSSGMNARLGFSIAVHLEPDVLIVDEVLSVGDASFQAQAFDRIRGLVKGDIPVVIVSHQLDRIVELCTECILLSKGAVAARGAPADVVRQYLRGEADEALEASTRIEGLRLDSIERLDREQVVSGAVMPFVLRGSTQVRVPDYVQVFIVVSTLASSERLYHRAVPDLRREGPADFEHALQLQANLPPGQYRLETQILNELSGMLYFGPATFFDVVDNSGFTGSVQLLMSSHGG
ncbi:MAG TPA: ABC transporter ATP-binding protein [Gemmatimonadales bacterium]|jgi:ABC-type polysaccharide/polyol phosphate transport system ATPase subunit